MGIWVERYKELRAAWVRANGPGAQSTATGATLPRMLAGDALALPSPFTAAVQRYLQRNVTQYLASVGPVDISHEAYLMRGKAAPGRAVRRTMPEVKALFGAFGSGVTLTNVPVEPVVSKADAQEIVRQIMASWQATIDVAAAIIAKSPPTRWMTADEVQLLWSKLYGLAVAVEVAGEIYTRTEWERTVDAFKHATRQTVEVTQTAVEGAADIAGRAAAVIAETAGKAAGAGVGGFFAEAGLTAVIVTAAAIYIALH